MKQASSPLAMTVKTMQRSGIQPVSPLKLGEGWLAAPIPHRNGIANAMRDTKPENDEPRFTLDGSEVLERHLSRICHQVREAVQGAIPSSWLQGLLLGGGYGRGEGGVLRESGEDKPYNDLEFYVLARTQSGLAGRKMRRALHQIEEPLSHAAGLEVEFKLLTPEALRRSGPTMFYYDLVLGHRRLLGGEDLLAGCGHHRAADQIPLHEAARLWMNRASGLLFSLERLGRPEFTSADADFVGRNLAKARLAWGDIVLAALGAYHWSCRERNRRLHALAAADLPFSLAEIRRHHDAGVEFKLHPVRTESPRAALAAEHRELARLGLALLLWLENRRLGTAFTTAREYARSGVDKCPETAGWKNWLLTGRALGLRAALGPGAWRYPRGRMLEALALLLEGGAREEPDRAFLRQRLHTRATDLAGLVAAHENLWRRFG
jgi:hypothetical protein